MKWVEEVVSPVPSAAVEERCAPGAAGIFSDAQELSADPVALA